MRFVRNCLGAIVASMALVAVPGQAAENNGYMVDGVSFEVGVGEHVELARVGFQWDWNKDWLRTAGGWHLNGYWDLNLGWWHGDRYNDGHGSQDLAVIGIGLLIAVLALTQLGLFLPMVLVAAYAFLSIHLDGLSVLDFLSFVVSFYITEQQIFEWEDPT